MPTVHLIKCCIYRHFKSRAQASPTLLLMQSSYYVVLEMQKSVCQNFQLYYTFPWSSHWEFRHHLLKRGNYEVLSLLVHNSKKYFSKFFFTKKILTSIPSDISTSVFNVIFANVRLAHVIQVSKTDCKAVAGTRVSSLSKWKKASTSFCTLLVLSNKVVNRKIVCFHRGFILLSAFMWG